MPAGIAWTVAIVLPFLLAMFFCLNLVAFGLGLAIGASCLAFSDMSFRGKCWSIPSYLLATPPLAYWIVMAFLAWME